MNQPPSIRSPVWLAALSRVDQLCHPSLLQKPSQPARARIFVISIFAALLVVVLSSIRDVLLGDVLRIVLSVGAGLSMLLILRHMKSSGNLVFCTHLFLITIALSLVIRTTLNPDGSQVMVSICTLGLIAAHVISSRGGLFWTAVSTAIATISAVRLTLVESAEFEVAWAVVIVTAAIGLWSCAHALGREITRNLSDEAMLQVREERDRLRAFAERAFPGIIEVAPGRIDYASKGVTQLLGYEVEDFVEAGLQEYVHPDDFWPVVETLQNAPTQVAQVEARLRHARGHWVWIAAFAIPYSKVTDEDRWIFAARDVERERQDRELGLRAERLEGVGLLAAGVAHDFNNLLTVVAGNAELLPEGDHRDNILLATDEAAGLTSRLLSFSQEQPREVRNFDVRNLLDDLQPILRSLLGEEIHLRVNQIQEPCIIRTDHTQLNQVILNVVTNARDAMPEGGTLTIDVNKEVLDPQTARELGLANDQMISISIHDDGIGMDASTLARAFDPFFTTKDGERGSGLGLASAYRLARRCGGHLHLMSEPGIGTTATLRMPVEEGAAEDTEDTDPVMQSQLLNGWVLVVEDDPNIRQLICDAFTEINVAAHSAADGHQALTEYADHEAPPVLLVTDVVMPGMRGSVVADKLRLQQPDLRVLFISGYSDVKLDPWYEDDLSVSFLAKPFKPSQLLQAATRLVTHAPPSKADLT